MKGGMVFVPDVVTSTRPLLLTAAKDKPVLISALAAECQVLLTLDRGDFGIVLETEVYGMLVTTPRAFLVREGLG
jgi:hypothetical protein